MALNLSKYRNIYEKAHGKIEVPVESGLTLSPYQQDIVDFLKRDSGNACVYALAGSAKTTTLVELSRCIPSYKKALFIAYNKHIADELRTKLPSFFDVRTSHSHGYRSLFANAKSQNITPRVDTGKIYNIVTKHVSTSRISQSKDITYKLECFLSRLCIYAKTFGYIPEQHHSLITQNELFDKIEHNEYFIDLANEYYNDATMDVLERVMAFKEKYESYLKDVVNTILIENNTTLHIVDFDDQLYLPYVHKIRMKVFDYIFVDELQDFNMLQLKLLQDTAREYTRVIGVGDTHQCWGGDGLVNTLINGSIIKKQVKALVVGDKVETLYKRGISYQPITNKTFYDNVESSIIKTKSGKSFVISNNHKCFVTYPEFGKGIYYVYLMYRKDKGFRLGILTGGFRGTIGSRANSEQPDKLWILGMYTDRPTASYNEFKLSLKYQILTCPFNHNGRNVSYTQYEMDMLFNEFGKNGHHLLNDMGISFEYPIYTPQSNTNRHVINITMNSKNGVDISYEKKSLRIRKYFSRYKDGYFYALNLYNHLCTMHHNNTNDIILIHEKLSFKNRVALHTINTNQLTIGMKIPVIHNNELVLDSIVSIEIQEDQTVYDIEIAQSGSLVVNDILSHNSIYQFRGSVSTSMSLFEKYFNARKFDLPICYRCSKAVIREAKECVSEIQLWDGHKHRGNVELLGEFKEDFTSKVFQLNDFIVCRFNAPLIEFVIDLFEHNKAFYFVGRDIFTRLEKLNKTLKVNYDHDMPYMIKLSTWYNNIKALYKKFGNDGEVAVINDTYQCMKALYNKANKGNERTIYNDMEMIISKLKTRPVDGAIRLSSIHRAKGLEADRVFFLDRDRLPMKSFSQADVASEYNLIYVAITRAKKDLFYIKSNEDFANDFYSNF